MNRYQFSVALNGKFLFRTDLIDSETAAKVVELHLIDKFKSEYGFTITRNEFPASYTSKTISN